jgi:lysyl-tRNA synthetase class 2
MEQRKAKLAALRAKGIDPFKNKFTPGETCKHARDNYVEGREISVAGRITAHREMGKSMFIDVRDQSGRIQIYAQKNTLGDELWEIFKHLDLGDFVGVRGKMFTTKTGEISIKLASGTGVSPVSSEKNATHRQDACATTETAQPPFVILAKALRPPPAKWHGLEDTEIRYRQRYLDLMANPEVKEIFLKRSEIIREIRNFLHSRGFVEVETPMMQAISGGAAAQPFKTHHNALGCDFYLRIALELYLKRLLVGGMDKVFEIGRNFRNEGLSRKHNPEFTMLEAYQAFGDYESMMELVQSMICHVAQTVLGTLKIPRNGNIELRVVLARFETAFQESSANLLNDRNRSKVAVNEKQMERVSMEVLGNFSSEYEALCDEVGQKPYVEMLAQAVTFTEEKKRRFSERISRLQDILQLTAPEISTACHPFDIILHDLKKLQSESEISLTPNWRHAKYKDLIREKAGADWFDISPDERRQRAHDLGAEITKDYADFEVTGAVFEKLIEPTLIQPTFVTHLPKELVPLAKLSPDDPTTVEVFECCINGQEIAPAYTEQNDPIEQRERLEHQAGGEQQKLDEDFLVALEHGMPPAGGMGMGIDRLCMMLLGQESIRDVILFPQLKPK